MSLGVHDNTLTLQLSCKCGVSILWEEYMPGYPCLIWILRIPWAEGAHSIEQMVISTLFMGSLKNSRKKTGVYTGGEPYYWTKMFCKWLSRTDIFPSSGRAEGTLSLPRRRITLRSIWFVSIFYSSFPSVLWNVWLLHAYPLSAWCSEVASFTVWDNTVLQFWGAFGGGELIKTSLSFFCSIPENKSKWVCF